MSVLGFCLHRAIMLNKQEAIPAALHKKLLYMIHHKASKQNIFILIQSFSLYRHVSPFFSNSALCGNEASSVAILIEFRAPVA